MQQGIRRLIPDKTTFEAMGLQNNSIKLSDQQLTEIPEGTPLDPIKYSNNTLVKGSGEAVYLIMGGQKKYLPWGDTSILNSYRSQGINVDKITSISDEELTNIRTDDGVPKTDFYTREEKRVNMWKPLLSMVCNFIPGVNLLYGAASGLLGKDLITGQKLSGGNRLLSLFGSIGAAGASVAKATELGTQVNKITSQINRLNDMNKGIKTLGQIALLARNINNLSVALTANDLFDGSGQKIQGANRFISGLSYAGSGMSNLSWGKLNIHLPFANTINPNAVDYLTKTYQLGVAATGKEGVLFGKELSEEERINFGLRVMAPYIGSAIGNINKDTNIIEAFKEQGVELGKDLYKGGQAWTQMALQAYQNALRYTPYFNQITSSNNSVPKDQDGYIKLDFAQELLQTFQSIRDSGKDILSAIKEPFQDYARFVAYRDGKITIENLKQELNEKKIDVEDVLQLAEGMKKYGKSEALDVTKLIDLATKNATAGEIFTLAKKYINTDGQITQALMDEWKKKCGSELTIVTEGNKKQIQINLNTAIEILRGVVIGQVEYLDNLMTAAVIGEAGTEGAKRAVQELGSAIVNTLKTQDMVKAWADAMLTYKTYGANKIDTNIMIRAYNDVTGTDITRAVWWHTVNSAIREAWMEYLRNQITP